MEQFFKEYNINTDNITPKHKKMLEFLLNRCNNLDFATHHVIFNIKLHNNIPKTLKFSCENFKHARSLYGNISLVFYYNEDITVCSVNIISEDGLNAIEMNTDSIEEFEQKEFSIYSKKGMSEDEYMEMVFNRFKNVNYKSVI